MTSVVDVSSGSASLESLGVKLDTFVITPNTGTSGVDAFLISFDFSKEKVFVG